MLKVARSMIVPVVLIALVIVAVACIYKSSVDTWRMNADLHRASMEHRDRLDAENRDSIRDRLRISRQLDRVERTLADRP